MVYKHETVLVKNERIDFIAAVVDFDRVLGKGAVPVIRSCRPESVTG